MSTAAKSSGAAVAARFIDVRDVAQLVRRELLIEFGSLQKFSVRIGRYAGGSSIYVSWVDGPSRQEVAATVGYYCGATFNEFNDDATRWHTSLLDGEWVQFGNNTISFTRRLSTNAGDVL